MATYIRKEKDLRYRKVPLKTLSDAPFKSFYSIGEGVSYNDDQVIEVEDIEGKRTIYYAYPKLCEHGPAWSKTNTLEGCRVTILTEITPAHLWVNVKGALYKIPTGLPEENGSFYFDMPMKTIDFEIEGDEYFKAAYGSSK